MNGTSEYAADAGAASTAAENIGDTPVPDGGGAAGLPKRLWVRPVRPRRLDPGAGRYAPSAEQMSADRDRVRRFLTDAAKYKGYERGEGQPFLYDLLKAFGHEHYKDAGAEFEAQHKGSRDETRFCDLLIPEVALGEMKRRGTDLGTKVAELYERRQQQDGLLPPYGFLCNFDDIWVFDFRYGGREPADVMKVEELEERRAALDFLRAGHPEPTYGLNREAVNREAADKMADLLNRLSDPGRGVGADAARRFVLQCVVANFSQCIEDLLPDGLFSKILARCKKGAGSGKAVADLFREMDHDGPPGDPLLKEVRYFNGRLFGEVVEIELNEEEHALLLESSKSNWRAVSPAIFGTLFQHSMGRQRRHALGAHYTSEEDILRVVTPSLTRPFRERIEAAGQAVKTYEQIHRDIRKVRVLDPACGSGNFLYVAYRELVEVEMLLLQKVRERFKPETAARFGRTSTVRLDQFHGIDVDEFAVELTKVTLTIGRCLAWTDLRERRRSGQMELDLQAEDPLPLENLDANIRTGDAPLCDWPAADVIVGNPPYISTADIEDELRETVGAGALDDLRAAYEDVSGRADYAVYWFRKAHDHLKKGGRAGLIATNTIKQNNSREASLDHVVEKGGEIVEAVSSMVWPGEAVVHVAVVNWIKGTQPGNKKLLRQFGDTSDGEWKTYTLDVIGSFLSEVVVNKAPGLACNKKPKSTFQGQNPNHVGFRLDEPQAAAILGDPTSTDVVKPFLGGHDLLTGRGPTRYVIDVNHLAYLHEVQLHRTAHDWLDSHVREPIQTKAKEERDGPTNKKERQNHARTWWHFWRARKQMMDAIQTIPRYIVCVRTQRRPLFEFVDHSVSPGDYLQVFTFSDDYSFGILHSGPHQQWYTQRCSTMKRDFRYTSTTIYDSYPWPQKPSKAKVRAVCEAAVALREVRHELMEHHGFGLRGLYQSVESGGTNRLDAAQDALDAAVRRAYGMRKKDEALPFLAKLNAALAKAEKAGEKPVGPGLPPGVPLESVCLTSDRLGPSGYVL